MQVTITLVILVLYFLFGPKGRNPFETAIYVFLWFLGSVVLLFFISPFLPQ